MTDRKTMTRPLIGNLRDHGIAVYEGSCQTVKPWRDAGTGRDYIYAGIFTRPALLVQMEAETGRCRHFRLPPKCSGPWGMAFTMDGHVLVTSCNGDLCRFDPKTGKLWVTARLRQWTWDITRGSDGRFYLATSSETRLFRYDAETEKLEDLGRLHPTLKYLRTVVDGADGYIYGSLGIEKTQVAAYHIATGRTTLLLPESDCGPDFPQLGRSSDGQVYTRAVTGNRYRLAHGEAFPEKKTKTMDWAQPALPDGRRIRRLDPDVIAVGEGASARHFPMTYKGDGSDIFHLAEGPGKTVYASTIMPLYLLRYTPATRKLENLGRGAPDNGEAYSFGHCDGKLYYACYSFGNLMCYDPARPLHRDPPGARMWKDNPRLLTQLGTGHNRPRAMFVDSRKRVWIGSFPEYGRRTGGLGCYETLRQTYVNNPVVIPNQSVIALTASESGDIVYGGTSIGGGSGTDPVTKAAHLFAWDVARRKLLWKEALKPGVTGILNLLYRDGKLYGTTGSDFCFFRFDVATRTMDYRIPSRLSACREQSMCWGPNGAIYGITWISLFRWRPETGKIEVLYRCSGAQVKKWPGGSLFHRGAVIIDGRYYFSCGPKVMSLRLPPEAGKS